MMKQHSLVAATIFLQAVLVLIGLVAIAFLLGEPHFEGRNVNATVFEVYFKDPFLAYAYVASIAFFVALYQAFQLLGYARTNEIFSPAAAKALRTIKSCALAMIGLIVFAELFLLLPNADEIPPAITLGLIGVFGSTVSYAVALVLEQILQSHDKL